MSLSADRNVFRRVLCTCAMALALCIPASAQEAGYVVRASELRQDPFDDAPRVGQLAERAPVRIVERQGAWMRVQSGGTGSGTTGWVRMLSVRAGSIDGATTGDSGMKAVFNVARTGASGQTVATGVRGLDKEDLRRASPDAAQVAKMESFAAKRPDAEAFGARAQAAQPEPAKATKGKSG